MARFTLLDLMHLVHTFALLTVPFSSATLTVWILAFHFLLVCLLEWDTAFPDTCPLPQISHFLDIYRTSFDIFKRIALFQNLIRVIFLNSNNRYYTRNRKVFQAFFSKYRIFYAYFSAKTFIDSSCESIFIDFCWLEVAFSKTSVLFKAITLKISFSSTEKLVK